MASSIQAAFILLTFISSFHCRVIHQHRGADDVKLTEEILRPNSPTEKQEIVIPMIIPTEVIDLSQRIQRDQMIHSKRQLPSFEAIKPNVESPVEVKDLGSLLSGDKVKPIPDPAAIGTNENCNEDCSGGSGNGNCTDCECTAPEGGENCDLQNCADKQENCECENETGNSKEEVDELLRGKRCCCGCCDCCCCGCCCCVQMATMAPAATMAPCNCCCCGCCCCGCCGCCGGY